MSPSLTSIPLRIVNRRTGWGKHLAFFFHFSLPFCPSSITLFSNLEHRSANCLISFSFLSLNYSTMTLLAPDDFVKTSSSSFNSLRKLSSCLSANRSRIKIMCRSSFCVKVTTCSFSFSLSSLSACLLLGISSTTTTTEAFGLWAIVNSLFPTDCLLLLKTASIGITASSSCLLAYTLTCGWAWIGYPFSTKFCSIRYYSLVISTAAVGSLSSVLVCI